MGFESSTSLVLTFTKPSIPGDKCWDLCLPLVPLPQMPPERMSRSVALLIMKKLSPLSKPFSVPSSSHCGASGWPHPLSFHETVLPKDMEEETSAFAVRPGNKIKEEAAWHGQCCTSLGGKAPGLCPQQTLRWKAHPSIRAAHEGGLQSSTSSSFPQNICFSLTSRSSALLLSENSDRTSGEAPVATSWPCSAMFLCLGVRTGSLCCSELPGPAFELRLGGESEPGRACASPWAALGVMGTQLGRCDLSHTSPSDHCRHLGDPQLFHYSSSWADLIPGAVGKVSSALRC